MIKCWWNWLKEEERQRTEEEMKRKLQEQQAQSENEIINLYKVRHWAIPV